MVKTVDVSSPYLMEVSALRQTVNKYNAHSFGLFLLVHLEWVANWPAHWCDRRLVSLAADWPRTISVHSH